MSEKLTRNWRLVALGTTLALVAGVSLVAWDLGWQQAAHWAILPVFGAGYILWYLRRHLSENHAGNGVLYDFLGWGNLITITRAVLLACLSGFLLLPPPSGVAAWAPGILYMIAVLLDTLDGYAARRTYHTTELGKRLDMEFDGWGMLIASVLIVQYGQAPEWYVLVGLARYIFVAGMTLRSHLGLFNNPLPANRSRRLIGALQMGVTFVLLWPLLGPPHTGWVALFFSLPLLFSFTKDWLIVCGRLPLDFDAHWEQPGQSWMLWVPTGLRFLAVVAGIALQVTMPMQLSWALSAIYVLLSFGIAPRVVAVLGMISLAQLPLSTLSIILLALYSSIVYLGGGRLSLWTPEGRIAYQKAG